MCPVALTGIAGRGPRVSYDGLHDCADRTALPGGRTVFEPRLSEAEREAGYAGWDRAVRTVRAWAQTRG